MTTEVLNKMIKYIMDRPYREVYELMDEIRDEVKKDNSAPLQEEVVDGN